MDSEKFLGEGRYGTVKKCRRVGKGFSNDQFFAVKEVRSNISDDFEKA